MRKLALPGLLLVAAVAIAAAGVGADTKVTATPATLNDVLRTVPDGAVVSLGPGEYAPFRVTRPIAVEGSSGVVVRGPVQVRSSGVRISGLRVSGGEAGFLVDHADDVVLEDVHVSGVELHGIEIAEGSAVITDCRISGLVSPFAQGLEVRNSNGHPRTVVRGCDVRGGQEGIVSHVSRVEFVGNRVSGTTMRAIAVTEMSEGSVRGNHVSGAAGIGLYCGDMSHCVFAENVVAGVRDDGSGVSTRAGYGMQAWYYSTVQAVGNRVSAPHELGLFIGSIRTQRSPLSIWPAGWAGALPAAWVAVISLLGLLAVTYGIDLVRRRRSSRSATLAAPELPRATAQLLAIGFGIQSFHMLEHVIQVWQVYVADAEIRSGLLGHRFDTEWLHFAYNVTLLAFLVGTFVLLRRAGTSGTGMRYLVGALVIQGHHFAEHVAKVYQHVTLGIDPAPGLIGGRLGLVLFHFGINLAVWAGSAVALGGIVATLVRRTIPPLPPRARVTTA